MEKFQKFADNSELSILLTDSKIEPPGPQIVYANANLLKMSGYTFEELVGRTPRVFQGVNTDRQKLNEMRQCLISGTRFSGAVINYRKDGSEFLMSFTIEPIDLDGTKYFYAVQTDMTGGLLKALEEVKMLQTSLLAKLPEPNNVSNYRESLSGSNAEGETSCDNQGSCKLNALRR